LVTDAVEFVDTTALVVAEPGGGSAESTPLGTPIVTARTKNTHATMPRAAKDRPLRRPAWSTETRRTLGIDWFSPELREKELSTA